MDLNFLSSPSQNMKNKMKKKIKIKLLLSLVEEYTQEKLMEVISSMDSSKNYYQIVLKLTPSENSIIFLM